MRWRVATLVALCGMVAVPATSDAVQPAHATTVNVTVKPGSGGTRTRFAVSFRAPVATGRSFHSVYRVIAYRRAHRGCQSAATVAASPSKAGSVERVVLAPSGSRRWCAGTFRGQVLDMIVEPCPVGEACPAIEPRPVLVGRFTFRVTRG